MWSFHKVTDAQKLNQTQATVGAQHVVLSIILGLPCLVPQLVDCTKMHSQLGGEQAGAERVCCHLSSESTLSV